MKVKTILSIALCAATGCASITGRNRILLGAGIGGLASGGTATYLSPNEESRGLNALVFGLGGALFGSLLAMITDRNTEVPKSRNELREKDLTSQTRDFQIAPNSELPQFVKDRLQPVIIEEWVESDSVSEDGVLHEPHKAYRVKNPGELFSGPAKKPVSQGVR